MPKLIVRRLGAEYAQIELESGSEYIVGRGQGCAIVLEDGKGISRQHLRIHNQGGVWVAELMSRYGGLMHDGQPVEAIELADQVGFSIPPYEFLLLDHVEEQQEQPNTEMREKIREEKSLVAQQPTELRPVHSSQPQEVMALNSDVGENTSAGISMLVPYLKISYPDHGKDEVVKLEGNLWVAGRDVACEIPIDDHHVSRRHFELTNTSDGVYITDLGSANGTSVNGDKIPANEPVLLQSGDRITIMDVVIDFEVRDTQFEQRLQLVARELPALGPIGGMVPHYDPYQAMMPFPVNPDGPAVVKVDNEKKFAGISKSDLKNPEFYKRNKIRIVIGLLLPVIFYGLIPDNPKGKADLPRVEPGSPTFEKLSDEQKVAIKDSFQLATSLYTKGKYELCLAELAKLHKIIPLYENSKELNTFCQQGSELTRKIADEERKAREKQRAEQQIRLVYDDCSQKMHPNISVQEVESCMGQAIELDPEHPLVRELVQNAMNMEAERHMAKQERQAAEARARSGLNQFKTAQRLAKTGSLAEALRTYQRFLNGGYNLPREREIASVEAAAVKKKLTQKVSSLISTCKALRGEGKFKDAYLTCAAAKKEDPDNDEAETQMKQAESELKTELKSVYEDSVLEESLGNIDAAKQKWNKIMADDLKNGDYYKKAQSKLKKYGVGI